MYEYMTLNQVADCDEKQLLRLTNEQIADKITISASNVMESLRKRDLKGWEIVSHSVQFFANRLVVSVLLRHLRQP